MSLPDIRILLIEDDLIDAQMISQYLAKSTDGNFILEHVDNLTSGLKRLEHGGIELVLLDLTLPEGGGLSSLDAVLKCDSTVPIVILTGVNNQSGPEAVHRGAQNYLDKNEINGPLLTRSLRYAFEQFQSAEELRKREQFLRVITSQLPCIFWTTDKMLRFTSSQGAGLASLGLETGEVVGVSLQEYLNANDPNHPAIQAHRAALTGASVSYEMKFQGKYFHTHVEPLFDGIGSITGTIGIALDVSDAQRLHQIEAELRVARKIQQGLLPKEMPRLEHYHVGGFSHPANATGGDCFDFMPMPDGTLRVVMGDVSSHGFGPALLMASIRAYLRAFCEVPLGLKESMTLLNRLLLSDMPEGSFATMFLVSLDLKSPALCYTSAGHPTGYIIDQTGTVKHQLKSTDPLLGVVDDHDFSASDTIPLAPGDIIILLTDGILESFSPYENIFGADRVIRTVQKWRHALPQQIAHELVLEIREFTHYAPQLDDNSAVIIKVRD